MDNAKKSFEKGSRSTAKCFTKDLSRTKHLSPAIP
jgi:hypothetical protein